jgi:hypothetical protein
MNNDVTKKKRKDKMKKEERNIKEDNDRKHE